MRNKIDQKLENLRNTFKINGVNRHYLYKTYYIPKILETYLRRGKKEYYHNLLLEYDVSYDLYKERWLSNVSLEFLIPYTYHLALKFNVEVLWNYYEKIKLIDYRKPPRPKKKTIAELRDKLKNPCCFVDCVNELTPKKELVLSDTYCLTCIRECFQDDYTPRILTEWKELVDETAKQLARYLGRDNLVKTFKHIDLVFDLRRFQHRRRGKNAHYHRYKQEIRLYLRKFNTETQQLYTYIHEVAHHYCENTIHGEEFQVFLEFLIEKLKLSPKQYSIYRYGSINWRYIMDIEIGETNV